MAVIVTFGELLAEFVAEEVGKGFLDPSTFAGPFPSGAPAIFADQAARMGATVAYIGHVGVDAFGAGIIRRLSADGVDVTNIIQHTERPTGTAFVAYDDDGSRSYVFNIAASASGLLGASSVPKGILRDARYLHVMGSTLNSEGAIAALQVLLDQAREFNVRISFDPNIRTEMLSFEPMVIALNNVFDRCHVFLPSEADLEFFFPNLTSEAALSRVFEKLNIESVVLKRGALGSIYVDRSSRYEASPLPVIELDPTGAGDCFGGTFVGALALGNAPVDALRLANAAGALAVTRRGPMEGNSTPMQIDNFLKEHSVHVEHIA
ncbi:2-dehydro-3-deoxygluconokinase [compost metagenome]